MHINRRVVSSLLAMVSMYALCAGAQSRPTPNISFPSQSKAASPNGRYMVLGIDSKEEPHHTIFLEDRKLKTRRKLLDYERSADVLWNPNSQSFALTDHGGSDFSLCSVIAVDPATPSVQVMDEIVKQLSDTEKRVLPTNHHVYLSAVKWISPKVLKVKVWGYGEVSPSGFTRYYDFDVDRRVLQVRHRAH